MKTKTPVPKKPANVKRKIKPKYPEQVMQRIQFLEAEELEAIGKFPQPTTEMIIATLAESVEAFSEPLTVSASFAISSRSLIEAAAIVQRSSEIPAISADNLKKIQKICGITEVTPEWYLNDILTNYLDQVLDGEMGALEGESLEYDSEEEAKRITAKIDKFEKVERPWKVTPSGKKFIARFI